MIKNERFVRRKRLARPSKQFKVRPRFPDLECPYERVRVYVQTYEINTARVYPEGETRCRGFRSNSP